jgi:hypothetical protein
MGTQELPSTLIFKPGDLVPAEPGDYLVITQDMQYHHCTAEFHEDEFSRFVGRSNQTIANLEILAHAKIQPTALIIKALYMEPSRSHQNSATSQLAATPALA